MAALSFDFQEFTMSGANEKWKELCEQVIAERDPNRLTELIAMLTDELGRAGIRKQGTIRATKSIKEPGPLCP
jgi:hypothetical protein